MAAHVVSDIKARMVDGIVTIDGKRFHVKMYENPQLIERSVEEWFDIYRGGNGGVQCILPLQIEEIRQ